MTKKKSKLEEIILKRKRERKNSLNSRPFLFQKLEPKSQPSINGNTHKLLSYKYPNPFQRISIFFACPEPSTHRDTRSSVK